MRAKRGKAPRGKVPSGGAGGNEMLRQAARLQRRMDEVRKELKDREVTASGPGEKVTVTVTCEGRVRSIDVVPDLVASEGLEMALDLVTATVNKALELADDTAQGEYDKVTGGVRMPGMG